MNTIVDTSNAPPPFSNYSQAVEVPAGARTLHVSGQVGNTLDGELPEDSVKQHEQAWRNVFAILEAAGMSKTDMVDVLAIVIELKGQTVCRRKYNRRYRARRQQGQVVRISCDEGL